MSRRPMLALLLVGSVLAWTVHRAMQKAKRTAAKAMPQRPKPYTTDEWDADDIGEHRSTSSGMLCPEFAVTWQVPTGSDIPQFVDRDAPKS